MLNLDKDCISNLYKNYIKNYVICKKNDCDLKKFYFCKKVYDICKEIKFINDCNIINILNIKLRICSIHDNVDISYIKNLLDCIESYKKKKNIELINITSGLSSNSYIHLVGLKNYEDLTSKILKKNNLKIKRYCCGGNGCMFENIN